MFGKTWKSWRARPVVKKLDDIAVMLLNWSTMIVLVGIVIAINIPMWHIGVLVSFFGIMFILVSFVLIDITNEIQAREQYDRERLWLKNQD